MTATGAFITGTLQSIVIIDDQSKAQVQLDGKRRMMEIKLDDELVTSAPIDGGGVVNHQRIPRGCSGTIEVEKANGNFFAIMKQLDQLFYNLQPGRTFTIVETINPPTVGGSVEQNTYIGCVFHNYQSGQYTRAAITTPRLEFNGSMAV